MHRVQTCLLLLLLAASASARTQQRTKPHKAAVKATHPQPEATPPSQRPAPPPPTPEQGPSSPPEVSFQDGRLTILARNSTMADVLNAVKQKTGAAVEMPSSSSERVVGQFGPGAPRDVMAQLLNGSHYDYVLLGSPSDPGVLQKVVLMSRASGPEPATPEGRANRVRPGTENLQAVPEVEAENTEENPVEPPPDAQQPQEEPQPEQPEGENGPTVKTPEQLLRELQQQQQQQQQQDQPPGQPPQPPQ